MIITRLDVLLDFYHQQIPLMETEIISCEEFGRRTRRITIEVLKELKKNE